ncbi:hypothetical protein KDX30_15490 [Pseudomonas sp. CDFA 553]|uniref:hypothetical protein n=1 Tax=Pseudomonas quasicaspiana TaxID=2829821 RepID=UPI001E4DA75E|nr:hypothetical protein [Pseudomonas quasicaspiana]MCD5989307.1 hypothetical protein [Pseudomonas quasicaspiana]
MKTKFQIALEKKELSAFFKGQGEYFSRDPDWGDHLYINNWQGLCNYLKHSPSNVLLDAFSIYLQSLKPCYKDADSLLLNISCYYLMRSDTQLMSSENFDLVTELNKDNKKIVGELFRILRRDYASKNMGKPVISLDQFLSEIKANGCVVELENL